MTNLSKLHESWNFALSLPAGPCIIGWAPLILSIRTQRKIDDSTTCSLALILPCRRSIRKRPQRKFLTPSSHQCARLIHPRDDDPPPRSPLAVTPGPDEYAARPSTA
uniref:Uncharacterized protein n=1 Tax=Bionectria ochroleuca TaxID=29856 RepID=A0A8H7NIR0_BIOOC